MTSASTSSRAVPKPASDNQSTHLKTLLPYLVAVLVQLPILFVYFRNLWGRPHYQFFPFAILAAVAMAWVRWPRDLKTPFFKSLTSDFLFVLGVVFATAGVLFMEPWFHAISATLIVTSLFARTLDLETDRSLWSCALPLFVCLLLPGEYDNTIITQLQMSSAHFTSLILDLIGQGHHLEGIKITLANGIGYDIEQGCSGVVSFFTLVAITVAYIAWTRRVVSLSIPTAGTLVLIGLTIMFIERISMGRLGYWSILGIGIALTGVVGFRAALLLMSTVFWSLFMNTLRILVIPLADVHFFMDLSKGIAHDLLGYLALILGVLLVLSTDHLFTFLFGAVEDASEESSGMQRRITRFWNNVVAGGESQGLQSNRNRKRISTPLGPKDFGLFWIFAGFLGLIGLSSLWFILQCTTSTEYTVRFFDTDLRVDFQEQDLPKMLANWEQQADRYSNNERSHGSDLGQRSDSWIYQGPKCMAQVSLDQTFPGWHELTTCYRNQGWNIEYRRVRRDDSANHWPYVEVGLSRITGEKGFLVFSLFDAQAVGIDAPEWDTLTAFLTRVKNRLNNRIRASLFDGAAYQSQVLVTSYREFDESRKAEIVERYLEAREILRQKFVERRSGKSTPSTPTEDSSSAPAPEPATS